MQLDDVTFINYLYSLYVHNTIYCINILKIMCSPERGQMDLVIFHVILCGVCDGYT